MLFSFSSNKNIKSNPTSTIGPGVLHPAVYTVKRVWKTDLDQGERCCFENPAQKEDAGFPDLRLENMGFYYDPDYFFFFNNWSLDS